MEAKENNEVPNKLRHQHFLLRNKSLMGDEFKFNIYILSVPDSLKGPHETCISKLVS